jgi:hypothetical protein
MKIFSTWLLLILITVALLATSAQATMAQTEPEVTPEGGYPPPATPVQLEDEAYPSELSRPTPSVPEAGYIAPTNAPSQPANNSVTVIGEEDSAATAASTSSEQAVPSLPISQSRLLRNRAILWAGFLITLLIFFTAVYGAMLMYRRRR